MSKSITHNLPMFFLFFLTSCNIASLNKPQLEFTIVYEAETFHSFEDVSATVTLKNLSQQNLLVNKRLFFRTGRYPPEMIEGVLLITDSSGQQISLHGHIDIGFPRDEFFVMLRPGQSIERKLSLHNVGFFPQYFKYNELYSVIAIYQNSLDVKQMIDGEEVDAWIGEVQSNPDTFMIVP